jgi:hypothetical protein
LRQSKQWSVCPKVSGSGQLYIQRDWNSVLLKRRRTKAKAMGDDYVSVEHLFLVSCNGIPLRKFKALFQVL